MRLVPRPRLSRAAGSRGRVEVDARLRAGWLRQDDAAHRVAGNGTAAPADQRLAAWLSLDPGDNDPASFWTYVIAALRTVAPGVGESALALLQAPSRPRSRRCSPRCSTTWAPSRPTSCWCSTTTTSIDAREVQDGMAFLLDHLPPRLHVVIASRADPALPLARLRARGELVEIRAAELRFTPDEAAAYLNGMMGLQLTARTWPRWRPHRGLDRRAPAGGAVDAGARRRRRLHRRLRRG